MRSSKRNAMSTSTGGALEDGRRHAAHLRQSFAGSPEDIATTLGVLVIDTAESLITAPPPFLLSTVPRHLQLSYAVARLGRCSVCSSELAPKELQLRLTVVKYLSHTNCITT